MRPSGAQRPSSAATTASESTRVDRYTRSTRVSSKLRTSSQFRDLVPSSATRKTSRPLTPEEKQVQLDRLRKHHSSYAVQEEWNGMRKCVARGVLSAPFEWSMNCIILFNLALVIYAADHRDANKGVVDTVGLILLGVYGVELMLKLAVWRSKFFKAFNVMDLTIVVLDLVCTLLQPIFENTDFPSVAVLRILRISRVLRATRVLHSIPEMTVMVQGMASTMRAMLAAFGLIGVALLLLSIACVELLQQYVKEIDADGGFGTCARCGRAFDTVYESFITLFGSIIAGDSWGEVSIPLMERFPQTAFLLIPGLVFISFGLLNLLLTAIVTAAEKSIEADKIRAIDNKIHDYQHGREQLMRFCQEMDSDHSGTISFEELERGYDVNDEFASMMTLMDVQKEELHYVFQLLDRENCGEVSYEAFTEKIYRLRTAEDHSLLVFLEAHMGHVDAAVGHLHQHVMDLSSAVANICDRLHVPKPCDLQPRGFRSTSSLGGGGGEESIYPGRFLSKSVTAMATSAAVGVFDKNRKSMRSSSSNDDGDGKKHTAVALKAQRSAPSNMGNTNSNITRKGSNGVGYKPAAPQIMDHMARKVSCGSSKDTGESELYPPSHAPQGHVRKGTADDSSSPTLRVSMNFDRLDYWRSASQRLDQELLILSSLADEIRTAVEVEAKIHSSQKFEEAAGEVKLPPQQQQTADEADMPPSEMTDNSALPALTHSSAPCLPLQTYGPIGDDSSFPVYL